METKLLAANEESLAWGAELLRRGELVAFPTETVYGLGANALDSAAVREIFAAKGRPADNPLIVHIWDREQLAQVCHVPPLAEKLMDAFWPGAADAADAQAGEHSAGGYGVPPYGGSAHAFPSGGCGAAEGMQRAGGGAQRQP